MDRDLPFVVTRATPEDDPVRMLGANALCWFFDGGTTSL